MGIYTGEHMMGAPIAAAHFQDTAIVIVTGATWNPCGHSLLCVGGPKGWYFHVDDFHGCPRCLGAGGFERYMRESGKREVKRIAVQVPNPAGALAELNRLLPQHWQWLVLPSNCVNFIETILHAGGVVGGLIYNCPMGAEVWGQGLPQPKLRAVP